MWPNELSKVSSSTSNPHCSLFHIRGWEILLFMIQGDLTFKCQHKCRVCPSLCIFFLPIRELREVVQWYIQWEGVLKEHFSKCLHGLASMVNSYSGWHRHREVCLETCLVSTSRKLLRAGKLCSSPQRLVHHFW